MKNKTKSLSQTHSFPVAPNTGVDEGYTSCPRCSICQHHFLQPFEEVDFPSVGSNACEEQIAESLSKSFKIAGSKTAEFGGSE